MPRNKTLAEVKFSINFKDLYCIARLFHSAYANEGDPFCECQYCRFACSVWDKETDEAKVLVPNSDFIRNQLEKITGVYTGSFEKLFEKLFVPEGKSPCIKNRSFSSNKEREGWYTP